MLNFVILIGGAALPSLALALWIYRRDRARPEPLSLVSRALVLGFLSTIPTIILGLLLDLPTSWLPSIVARAAWSAFIAAALLEESIKYFIIKRFFYRLPAFDETLDGIVYAVMVSLGFAFAENILYGLGSHSWLLLRAFTAVPLHAAAAGIMGYWFGQARVQADQAVARRLLRRGWLLAVLVHGAYDFCLMLGGVLTFGALLVLLASLVHLLYLIRQTRAFDDRLNGAQAGVERPERERLAGGPTKFF